MNVMPAYFNILGRSKSLVDVFNAFSSCLAKYKLANTSLENVTAPLPGLYDEFDMYYPHQESFERKKKEGFSQLIFKTLLHLDISLGVNDFTEKIKEYFQGSLTQKLIISFFDTYREKTGLDYIPSVTQPQFSKMFNHVDFTEKNPEMHWTIYFNLMKFLNAVKLKTDKGETISSYEKLFESAAIFPSGRRDETGQKSRDRMIEKEMQLEVCIEFTRNFLTVRRDHGNKLDQLLDAAQFRIDRNSDADIAEPGKKPIADPPPPEDVCKADLLVGFRAWQAKTGKWVPLLEEKNRKMAKGYPEALSELESGGMYKIRIKPLSGKYYVYIFNIDSKNIIYPIFPIYEKEVTDVTENPLYQGSEVNLPNAKNDGYRLDSNTGTETFRVYFFREKNDGMEKLVNFLSEETNYGKYTDWEKACDDCKIEESELISKGTERKIYSADDGESTEYPLIYDDTSYYSFSFQHVPSRSN